MKEFFEFIKAHIQTNLPEFKTIAMWNDQLEKGNADRTEIAIRYPAVWTQFVTSEVRNRSLGIQDALLQVIFHLAFEGYKYSEKRQLADMTTSANFDKYIHRLRGNEDDTAQFTTFQRIIINESEDFDNVNTPIFTYMTMLRLQGSYRAGTDLSGWAHDVQGQIVEQI